METEHRHILVATFCLLACISVFDLTSADLAFQALFFEAGEQRWVWSNAEPVSRFLLYDGAKLLLICIALALAVGLLWSWRYDRYKRYRRGMRIVLLSLILVPACVYVGKATSNVACPRDLVAFGGQVAHTGVVEGLLSTSHPDVQHRCFPAGHASGGFALLSLFWLFQEERNRRRALYGGLLAGWAMGAYKIAIGDHFLRHTVVTMILAWLVINVVVLADSRLFRSGLKCIDVGAPARGGHRRPAAAESQQNHVPGNACLKPGLMTELKIRVSE